MSSGSSGTRARAMLEAWREHGADLLDPVRFHFMEALDRRAGRHSGEVRRILDDRLSQLLGTYADDLERAASRAADAGSAATPGEPVRGALAGLIDYIAGHAPADRDSPDSPDSPAARSTVPRPPSYSKLEALDYFREIWSKVSTDRQLRQSLEQVPENAGPLNSSSIVYRSLALMRELSPEYLQKFLSYVDALSWMEQMNGGGASAGKDAPRARRLRMR